MQIDVATFNSMYLMTFLCSAVVTTALARMFERVVAFRFWAIAFFLLAAAAGCFALHLMWHNEVLLLATATLFLQSRVLVWSGTRALFGMTAPWRLGLAFSAVFCVLYSITLAVHAPMVVRATLLTVFFLPCRAATLYEVCRRQRPDIGPARMLIVLGSIIVMLNAALPLVLVMLHQTNMSLLLSDTQTTSAVYAVVFAGDLLLTTGLIVMALQILMVERDMLARLDKGALQRVIEARPPKRDAIGNDTGGQQRSSLPGPV